MYANTPATVKLAVRNLLLPVHGPAPGLRGTDGDIGPWGLSGVVTNKESSSCNVAENFADNLKKSCYFILFYFIFRWGEGGVREY